MLFRATAVWCLILLCAILNGGVREKLVRPRLGEEVGHVLSTVLLCGVVLLVAWWTIGWLGAASAKGALVLGGLWVVLTLAFELLGGHYLFGSSWQRLFADYNVLRGRVWILVLLTTLFAPAWAYHLRRP